MSERILIIDDEETLRESLGRLLTREGYDVTTTGTGEDALELTGSAIYDLGRGWTVAPTQIFALRKYPLFAVGCICLEVLLRGWTSPDKRHFCSLLFPVTFPRCVCCLNTRQTRKSQLSQEPMH